jgi:4-amino-4-deoxy-L-arabinose transferase-like glycosyltransferase
MNFIKKNLQEILVIILLIVCYFLLRLINLNSMPIFTDEAIYTRWAQIALNDASWRFISLTDGKQPLFVWTAMIFMKFIKDPLIAARLVSVLTGFFTLVGLWFLSFELFKNNPFGFAQGKRVAYLTSILYVFYPFAQINDRMALMDSMVATFSVWALYFSILLVRRIKLSIVYTLGITAGLGALTKSSNFFSLYLLPFTILLFDFSKVSFWRRFFKWVVFAIFSIAIAQVIYNILRLSPLFQMIQTKNATFVFPLSQWLQHPFSFFAGNINGLFDWLISYLKIPYMLLIIVSLIRIYKFFKEKLLLIIYFLLPFLALALFGKVIFPRFIFFMSVFLLPLAAIGLYEIINFINLRLNKTSKTGLTSIVYTLVTVVFIAYPCFVSYKITSDLKNAPIADSDSRQYVNSWAAGWGVSQSVAFFTKQAESQKIFVATEGTFGLMPESLELYLIKNKNIIIKGYWPVEHFLPKEAIDYSKKMPSFFVFYQPNNQKIDPAYPLKLIFQQRAGNSDSFYRVYQIIPPGNK